MSESVNPVVNAEPVATPTPQATPSAPTIQSAPTSTPPTTVVAPQAPATGAPEGYVPSYRLRETREAAVREAQAQFAQERAALQRQYDQVQNQLRALVGIQAPQNPELDAVRSQFAQLYPGLSKIEQRAQDFEALLERSNDFEAQTAHYWQAYGQSTMDKLFTHATESLGGSLTDEAKRHLHASFVGFVQSSPELEARYGKDPSLVEDFWKAFSSSFIDPVRRSATATVVGRAPQGLPQDSPAGAPRATPAPNLGGLDERANAAWTQFQALKNQP